MTNTLSDPSKAEARRVVVFRDPLLSLSETFVRDQVLGLRRWQATLVGETMVAPRTSLDGIRYCTLARDGRVGRAMRRIDHALERLSGRSLALARALRSVDPAFVHVHFGTDAVRIWPTVATTGLRMLVTLHGFDIHTRAEWWTAGHGGEYLRTYPERLRAMARDPRVHFVAVSRAVQRAAIAYGLPTERIRVQHIGVDTRKAVPGPVPLSVRPREVLFVGRLVEKKGAIFLIRAAARVASEVPGLRLVLVGDGPLRAELERAASDLGVDATFLGAQPHDAVLRRFAETRVFCLPSITADNGDAEGLPIVLLEAQSCGVPTIASAEAAGEEAIEHGITGFAFPERDVEALADHLRSLLVDSVRSDAMSLRAAAFMRARFDLADCTAGLERLYDAVADDRWASLGTEER